MLNPAPLIPIYNKLPITFSHGDGIWLYDNQGEQYLDALTGIGVCALGHNHPEITQTIIEQAQKLLHVPNTFYTEPQSQLASLLCKLTGLDGAYFSNSGAEASEAVIKMALKYGTQKKYTHPKIIVMEGGFHGRSLGAWSGSCDPLVNNQFGPLLDCFYRVPFNQIQPILDLANLPDNQIVAIMLEPVSGKGGLLPAEIPYLKALRKICDQQNWLLIFDEVQSGMGRTGKLFAYQHADIAADIVATAKALGNGIPIGAYIANHKAIGNFQSGDHGSTQGGNVFSCAVGLTVLQILQRDNLYQHITEIGTYLQNQLHQALQPFDIYEKIQGKGLMIGIKLRKPVQNAIKIGLKHRIIFNHAGKNVIRLLPPFIITKQDADLITHRMADVLRELSLDR